MNLRTGRESLKSFFIYAACSSIGTMITTHFEGKGWIEILKDFSLRYSYGIVIGLIGGLGWMWGQDLYIKFQTKKAKK